MPSRHHSLSSRHSGFIPLHGGGNRNNDMHSEGIQLTPVRSNVSTGARKPDMAHTSSIDTAQQEKEGKQHGTHRFRRGRRQKKDEDLGRKEVTDADDEDGDGASLNFMGRLYYKIIGFSVVSRYLVYIVPVGLVLAVPLLVLPLTGHKGEIGVGNRTNDDGDPVIGPWLFDVFLWVEIAWLTVWAAKLGAWFLPKLFMFFSGIVSKGTRKYAMVLVNLSIPLSLFFWALACFISFRSMFSKFNTDNSDGGIPWVRTFTNIQAALFVCSAVFLGEKAIVQLIGVTYHQRSFAVRIKESKREVRLLGLLYDASRTLFPMYCPEFEEEDYVINDGIEAMIGQAVGQNGSKSGSATPMRFIGEVGRVGGKVTSAFGNIASEITGKEVFNPNSAHSIVVEALEKLKTSEALARRIWMSFVVEDREALIPEDFSEVLGPAHKVEADEAFYMVDDDENGDISLDEMIRKVVDIGKERKAIAEGMKDIGQALGAFDKVLLFVVFLICVFIFLIFFNSSFVTVIASAGTTLLSLSFIFAVTCQEFLGSCIFLFVKHPYDVGDRVVINDVQLVVERISLLYSVFTRNDTQQVSQIPNIVLNNYWVDNISRSKAMYESFNVNVSFDTSFEDIELLRAEMERFVRDPENSRDFKPDFTIGVSGVNNLDALSLGISILHKSNWHNEMVRSTRRSKFMCALAGALKKIPIYGPGGGADALGAPENPTYSVAVTDDFATKAREDSAKAKAEARLVPPPGDADEAKDAEESAISGINSRPPVREMAATGQWDGQHQMLGSDLNREESQRSRDIEGVRTDLLKRASTRGRRRQGESMQSVVVEGEPPAGSPVSPTHSRRELWDEEAQLGGRPSIGGSSRPMPRGGSIRSPLSPRHPPTEQR